MKRCPQCGKQYSTEANFCPVDAGRLEEVPDDAPAEPDDQVLGGRFVIGDHVGDGGMTGQVFEGTDNQTDERCVIKWVDRDVFASPLQMQRTERELKQLERATAPGIARVLGHGRKGDRLWFASEHFSSTSLRDIVAEDGPLPAERAAKLVHAVGTALSEAAKLGVIHRDVAPKNVLVGDDDAVKVINFGIAVPTTPSVRGVPEYVAPEQVDGKPVDQRSNIYSLGAMYFFLVTGRPPFEGDPQTVHSAHLHSPPPKASEHAEVSAEVDKLIDRALAKQSSRRYMTLRQLLGELEKLAGIKRPSTAKMASAKKKREKDQAAQTMLGVGALSADGYVQSRAANKNPSAVADLAPPVEGSIRGGAPSDEVDEEAKTNKLATVSSGDGASTSGEIGAGEAGHNGAQTVDDRPEAVSGEIGGNGASAQVAGDLDELEDTDADAEGESEGEDEDAAQGEGDGLSAEADDFDSRATQPNKRKKRRRRRKKRKTRRPPQSDNLRDAQSPEQGEESDEGEAAEAEADADSDADRDSSESDEERPSEISAKRALADRAEDASSISEKELVKEVTGGSSRLMIAGGVVALIVVIVVVALMMS